MIIKLRYINAAINISFHFRELKIFSQTQGSSVLFILGVVYFDTNYTTKQKICDTMTTCLIML